MKLNTRTQRLVSGACLLLAGAFLSTTAFAGTFETIDLNGSSSQFAGVADSYTFTSTGDPIDIASVQIVNDSNFLYLNLTFFTPVNVDGGSASGQTLNLAFDTDDNAATGFNVYGNAAIGSELAYQYDYPFAQGSGNFNTGAALTGAGAEISPYNTTTSSEIIAIPLTSTYTATGALVFGQSNIALEAYATNGTGNDDVTSVISYDLASATVAPEPQTWALLLGGFVLIAFVVRRKGASI
jgi:hypothetical protein